MKCVCQWGIPHFHQCKMENMRLAWEKLKAGCVVPQTTADLVASSVLSSLQFKYTLQELGSPQPSAMKSFPSGTIRSTCSNSPSSSAGVMCVTTSRAVEAGTGRGGCTTSLLPTPGSWEAAGLLLEHRGVSGFINVLLGPCSFIWAPLMVWAGAVLPGVQARSLWLAASCRDTCKARQSWAPIQKQGMQQKLRKTCHTLGSRAHPKTLCW